jgi:hypothetical protein
MLLDAALVQPAIAAAVTAVAVTAAVTALETANVTAYAVLLQLLPAISGAAVHHCSCK